MTAAGIERATLAKAQKRERGGAGREQTELSTAFLEETKAYLERLGGACPWPIETAHDLREYASEVAFHCEDELTGAELRRVNELVAKLDDYLATPAQRARKAKREARRARTFQRPEGVDELTWIISLALREPRTAAWQAEGARTRREGGRRPQWGKTPLGQWRPPLAGWRPCRSPRHCHRN
jgi:hypothetical protein